MELRPVTNYIAKERPKVSSFLRAIPSSRKRRDEFSNFDRIHRNTPNYRITDRNSESSVAVARSRGFIAIHPSVILIAIATCNYRVSPSAVDVR